MFLLDQQTQDLLPPLYAQEKETKKIAYARFYLPDYNWEWYAMEYSPLQKLFYGLVDGNEKEFGYFTLDELAALQYSVGSRVLRDYEFEPTFVDEL